VLVTSKVKYVKIYNFIENTNKNKLFLFFYIYEHIHFVI